MIILPTTEVRQKMGELLKRITDTQEPCVITQRGHTVAVLMDIDRYQTIMDELEDAAMETTSISFSASTKLKQITLAARASLSAIRLRFSRV